VRNSSAYCKFYLELLWYFVRTKDFRP